MPHLPNTACKLQSKTSYAIALDIAHAKRPYSGDFIRKNIEEVMSILDPNYSKLWRLITHIPVSCHTTKSHISDISTEIEREMTGDLKQTV